MRTLFVHSELPVGGAEVLRRSIALEISKRQFSFRICLIQHGGGVAEKLKSASVPVDELRLSNSIYNPMTTLDSSEILQTAKPDDCPVGPVQQ